ncbi:MULTISPECIES: hypothetical protein [Thermoanaerobacterium]|uniref:Lipoprotein n=1 Tax=Thermoanaerobacterium butyriciformans TaxID=1702242 RepID=A0ABS4NHB0_9THEO|nr:MULTISPECIES: hypothetical protein [Thermoanaerobacterium]KAA5806606.1 hypothetical protein F1655_09075 [Thermoanaerobacterium thermosaccharolyticum]MBP2073052.1 hypothetical protein [Thermoanaerobacterium butyriciformans]
MKIRSFLIFVSILSIIIVFAGCNLSQKITTTNPLKITQNDKKIILNYLDTKTNDIAYPNKEKMYSAFELLGTDKDKIYIWLVKEEYIKTGTNLERGQGVSLPVVLKIKKNSKGISIISHDFPKDGVNYNKDVKKLFPANIRFPNNEEIKNLVKVTETRAEEDLKNSPIK